MKKNMNLKIAILSISFLLMTRLSISPALAEIGKAFPSVSQGTLMNMMILPSLLAIPFGFISGAIANIVKKRTILFTALTLYLIGGIGPMFVSSFGVIIFFRVILGIGTGLFIPLATGLIADFFQGEERTAMIGFQDASVAVGQIVTGLIAGVAAVISWRFSFGIYAFGILVFILTFFKLPEPDHVASSEPVKKYVNGKILFICIAIFVYTVVNFAFFGYISTVVEGHNFGNSASSGLATTLETAGSLVMGVLFHKVYVLLKQYCVVISALASSIGFFLLAEASGIGFIFMGSVFIGISFGIIMPLSVLKVTEASIKPAVTFTNGLFMTFVNLGSAVAPTILVAMGSAFHNGDGQFIFLCSAVCFAIGTFIALAAAILQQRNKKLTADINN